MLFEAPLRRRRYRDNAPCLLWGGIVASLVYALIQWRQPGLVLKIIMGYALGAYVSIPSFGLLDDASIPDSARSRHTVVSAIPLLTYILFMIAFPFALQKIQIWKITNVSAHGPPDCPAE
jgi:hypothetical protein